MNLNEKALRAAVRAVVAEYKVAMLGRSSITDIGGRKWCIEYSINYWREDWKDWDYYISGNREKDAFWYLRDALEHYPIDKLIVEVSLICDSRTNETKRFHFDGTPYTKEVADV